MKNDNEFTPKELFNRYRDELTYDSNHIVQRTGWFVTAQAFMFSAVVIGIERSSGIPWQVCNSLLHPAIPSLGLFVSVCVWLSVIGSVISAARSRRALRVLIVKYPKLAHALPKRAWYELWIGLAPPLLFPVVFGITWAAMLVPVQFFHCS